MLLIRASSSALGCWKDLRLSSERAYKDISRRRFNCSYFSFISFTSSAIITKYLNKRDDAAKRHQPHIIDVKHLLLRQEMFPPKAK